MAFDPLSLVPAAWRIAAQDLVRVTSGQSGAHVFRIAGHESAGHYLKVASGADADHLRGEAERTQWLAAMDIRVPAIIRQFDGATAFAVTMSALDGEPAACIGAEDPLPAVRAIARAIRELHALPPNSCPFDETLPVRLDRARDLIRRGGVDAADFDARNAGVSPEELFGRIEASIPAREDRVVTHGDATLSNLTFSHGGKIGFIDCGNCGTSDRYIDLALLVGEIEEHFGDAARSVFLSAYGDLHWDERKAEFYRDLYELF